MLVDIYASHALSEELAMGTIENYLLSPYVLLNTYYKKCWENNHFSQSTY